MADLGAQLSQLTPEQRQAVMLRAKQEADQQIFADMLKKMTTACFDKCAGSAGDKLDSREQACMAYCQDRYLEARAHVQEALTKRQGNGMM